MDKMTLKSLVQTALLELNFTIRPLNNGFVSSTQENAH